MLRNLVNRHDLLAFVEKMRSDGLSSLARRFGHLRSGRVREAWSAQPGDDQWWVVDAVRRRWRTKLCGDAEVPFIRYFCDRYLAGRTDLDALMVGCGSGHSLPA